MTGNTKRFGNSGFIFHQINWCTYLLYRFICLFYQPKIKSPKNISPLLITGLFRSGTTITARLIKDLGYSAGPENHLLQGKGWRQQMNPDGFLENYLFMELSLYHFLLTTSWGDAPPSDNAIAEVTLNESDRHKLAKFSILKIHDDRISNWNKIKALLKNNIVDPEAYTSNYFPERSFIKNPHFAVQLPYFKKVFPSADLLFVFKPPAEAIQGAKLLSPIADHRLYASYYTAACNEHKNGNRHIAFFSHQNLCNFPEESILKLAAFLKAGKVSEKELAKQVKKKENMTQGTTIPDEINSLFQYMNANCINPQ